jgi:hypothetical protein
MKTSRSFRIVIFLIALCVAIPVAKKQYEDWKFRQSLRRQFHETSKTLDDRTIGMISLGIGVCLLFVGFYGAVKLSRYRFENMTQAGVVEFDSWGAAVRHKLKNQLCVWAVFVGFAASLFGGALIYTSP